MKLNKFKLWSVLFFSAFIFFSCQKPYKDFPLQADTYLTEANFQGTVLVTQGKKIIFQKAYGLSDEKAREPLANQFDTVYEIGSITKQMTAACILQQVEQKKISLDDTIDRFFPDYQFADQITISMLLNMRSGLLDHINSPDEFFGNKLYRQISKNELAGKNVDRKLVLESLYKAPLLTKPNSTYFYSNTNYYLLALILEELTGQSYEDYMEENIFKKADMSLANTEFQGTTCKGYFQNRYYSIPKNMAVGCGDVNACAMDIYKWNTSLASGKIIKKKTFEKMINSDSYGYGVYRADDSILHSGTTYTFNSYNEYFLKDKISVIVLSNKPINEINTTVIAGNLKKLLFL